MRSRNYIGAIIIGVLLTSALCFALVRIEAEGRWPNSWPKELDPLRKQAQTVGVAHGIQENVYVIPFKNQEDFEKAWPHILKVKSKGAPLILEKDTYKYHVSGTKALPGVMILAPSQGFVGNARSPQAKNYVEMAKQVTEGTRLHASAPWPKSILSDKGVLPEYVTHTTDSNGKMQWVDAKQFDKKEAWSRSRARVDIILITDGKIVDLNRIIIPANTPIIDNRFKKN